MGRVNKVVAGHTSFSGAGRRPRLHHSRHTTLPAPCNPPVLLLRTPGTDDDDHHILDHHYPLYLRIHHHNHLGSPPPFYSYQKILNHYTLTVQDHHHQVSSGPSIFTFQNHLIHLSRPLSRLRTSTTVLDHYCHHPGAPTTPSKTTPHLPRAPALHAKTPSGTYIFQYHLHHLPMRLYRSKSATTFQNHQNHLSRF